MTCACMPSDAILLHRARSVRSSSHSETRRRQVSSRMRRRRTAGDADHQRMRHLSGLQSVLQAGGQALRQRLWSEGNAVSRTQSRFGSPRRTDSKSTVASWQSDSLRLAELARTMPAASHGSGAPDFVFTAAVPDRLCRRLGLF